VAPGGPMMGSDATRSLNHLSLAGDAGGGFAPTSGGFGRLYLAEQISAVRV
jgi:hypothetical protein